MKQTTAKKRIKFNIVDVAVILVIIAAFFMGSRILGIGTRLGVGAEPTKAIFTVEVKDGTKELFNQMQVGDTVNIALDSIDYATITEISEATPTLVQGFDSISGKYKFTAPENPNYTAYITLEANANEDDSSVYVGNTVAKVGKPVYVKGKGYSGKGYIVTLDTTSKK